MASQGTNTANSVIMGTFLPVAPVLIPLAVHFLLVCFVLLITTGNGWLPLTYLFSHVFFFIVGLWTAFDRENILPVIMFIVVIAMTILLDIIQLGIYFGTNQDANGGGRDTAERTWQFSAAMAIINLLFKPVTVALACVAVYARTGGNLKLFGSNRDSYSVIHGTSDEQQSQ